MASMWRRAMHYLGLGPDEDYDDYDLLGGGDPEPPRREAPPREAPRRPSAPPRDQDGPMVRTLWSTADRAPRGGSHDGSAARQQVPSVNGHAPPERSGPQERTATAERPGPAAERPGPAERPSHGERPGPRAQRPAVVRPLAVPPSAKPHVVSPASFTDAQEVADEFKRNVPVIVNLQGVERDLMRRIIDFSSGLCYGLSGQMERVANHVYLLTPSDVEVSPEERKRLRERGYEA